MCDQLGVEVINRSSHTLYPLDQILIMCGGFEPLNYSHFQNVISSLGPPPAPKPTITLQIVNKAYTPVSDEHDMKYGIPTLAELGFDLSKSVSQSTWIGGETQALMRLERHLQHKAWIDVFGVPKLNQQSLFGTTHTGLSPYLRFWFNFFIIFWSILKFFLHFLDIFLMEFSLIFPKISESL